MITYNDICEAERKERYSDQLQQIPKTFLKDVAEYLKEKKEMASEDSDVFSDVIVKTKKQLENAITFFRALIRRRKEKILKLVFIASETGISKQDFENMFPFEKTLFEDLMKSVDLSEKTLNGLLNGGVNEEQQKNDLVVFIESLEEFMGMDGEKMGPFEKGQIANIPKEIAKILIDGKKAELVAD